MNVERRLLSVNLQVGDLINVGRGGFKNLPKEVLSEYGKKGAQKTAEVKREKKRLKESLDILLQMPLKARGQVMDIEEIKAFAQLKGKNMTVEQAMLIAQIQRALKGDTKAFSVLRNISGFDAEDW